MKNIRIGNDIVVTWSIYKDGEPYILDGLALSLYLCHAFGKTKIKPLVINGHNIVWVFNGKDQKYTGNYSLELVINEGKEGMATTDHCDFVRLVPSEPCCEGHDDENVVTESIRLESSVAFAPAVIREEAGGLQYATERTVYLTKIEIPDEPLVLDITEEQRAYNIETLSLADGLNVCLSYMGSLLSLVAVYNDGAVSRAEFNVVQSLDDSLMSGTIIITADGNAVLNIKEISTGLKYSVERTVHLTRAEYEGDEPIDVEITEEERAYNIETYTKAYNDRNVFISYIGTLLSHVLTVGHRYVSFNCVAEIEGVLTSMTITISANGDAVVVVKTIQTGLQYAIERTVYPTRGEAEGYEPTDYKITEEERAYNIETYDMAWHRVDPVFVSLNGTLFNLLAMSDEMAAFNAVSHISMLGYNGLYSFTITITKEGDAILSLKLIQTGGGSATPSDMNRDFNNDF